MRVEFTVLQRYGHYEPAPHWAEPIYLRRFAWNPQHPLRAIAQVGYRDLTCKGLWNDGVSGGVSMPSGGA